VFDESVWVCLMGGVVVRVEYALRVTHVLWGDMWLQIIPMGHWCERNTGYLWRQRVLGICLAL